MHMPGASLEVGTRLVRWVTVLRDVGNGRPCHPGTRPGWCTHVTTPKGMAMDYQYGLLLESLMDRPTRHRTHDRFATTTPGRARRWHRPHLRWSTTTPRKQLRARTT